MAVQPPNQCSSRDPMAFHHPAPEVHRTVSLKAVTDSPTSKGRAETPPPARRRSENLQPCYQIPASLVWKGQPGKASEPGEGADRAGVPERGDPEVRTRQADDQEIPVHGKVVHGGSKGCGNSAENPEPSPKMFQKEGMGGQRADIGAEMAHAGGLCKLSYSPHRRRNEDWSTHFSFWPHWVLGPLPAQAQADLGKGLCFLGLRAAFFLGSLRPALPWPTSFHRLH